MELRRLGLLPTVIAVPGSIWTVFVTADENRKSKYFVDEATSSVAVHGRHQGEFVAVRVMDRNEPRQCSSRASGSSKVRISSRHAIFCRFALKTREIYENPGD